MKWFYFIREGKIFYLAPPSFFPKRPKDARPSNNPHTPYYRDEDHFDDEHIHVKADSLEEAIKKALIIQNG